MDITIKNEEYRFGCRTVAIVFNNDMSKVLVQKIKDVYMFIGGRMHVLEDSKSAIERELEEELNINEKINLKYTSESILTLPNGQKYHEIGYYYLLKIDEKACGLDYTDEFLTKDVNDGDVYFKWIKISDIENYKIIPKNIAEKVKKIKKINNKIEHIIYKEN